MSGKVPAHSLELVQIQHTCMFTLMSATSDECHLPYSLMTSSVGQFGCVVTVDSLGRGLYPEVTCVMSLPGLRPEEPLLLVKVCMHRDVEWTEDASCSSACAPHTAPILVAWPPAGPETCCPTPSWSTLTFSYWPCLYLLTCLHQQRICAQRLKKTRDLTMLWLGGKSSPLRTLMIDLLRAGCRRKMRRSTSKRAAQSE